MSTTMKITVIGTFEIGETNPDNIQDYIKTAKANLLDGSIDLEDLITITELTDDNPGVGISIVAIKEEAGLTGALNNDD